MFIGCLLLLAIKRQRLVPAVDDTLDRPAACSPYEILAELAFNADCAVVRSGAASLVVLSGLLCSCVPKDAGHPFSEKVFLPATERDRLIFTIHGADGLLEIAPALAAPGDFLPVFGGHFHRAAFVAGALAVLRHAFTACERGAEGAGDGLCCTRGGDCRSNGRLRLVCFRRWREGFPKACIIEDGCRAPDEQKRCNDSYQYESHVFTRLC